MLLLGVISLGIKEWVFVATTWLVICCPESHEYYTYKHYNYYRYQLNYFICFKDFNAETNTSLKLNCLLSLFAAVSIIKGKRTAFMYIFLISDR